MAGSRWAYVRNFELPDTLLPNTFILLRIDGHSFHRCACPFYRPQIPNVTGYNRFADDHAFVKPNDVRALELMDLAAWTVMREYPDVVLAYGQSDEYRYSISPEPSRESSHYHTTQLLASKIYKAVQPTTI